MIVDTKLYTWCLYVAQNVHWPTHPRPSTSTLHPPDNIYTSRELFGGVRGEFLKNIDFLQLEALRMDWKLYKNTLHRKPTKLSTISVTHFLETFLQAWNQIKNEAIQATAFVLLFIRLQLSSFYNPAGFMAICVLHPHWLFN